MAKYFSLEKCDGPVCPRCGCQDAQVLQEPSDGGWWASGRARCRHCRNVFGFSRIAAQPADQAAPTRQSPPTAPTPVLPPPRPPAEAPGLSPNLVFAREQAGEQAGEAAADPHALPPSKTVCPACGGRYWVDKTRGEVQYRKCKDCGHRGTEIKGDC